MLIINTRPESRRQALTAGLREQGWQVAELPLLSLVPTDLEGLAPQLRELAKMRCIVVVSPTAVELGMQALAKAGILLSDLAHIEWIAVGQGTAAYLRQWNIEAHIPVVETSEGMLQLPYLQQLPVEAGIAFWRGEGGRTFMMQQLIEKGHAVLNLVLYTRQLPASSSAQFLNVVQQRPDVVLISSEASWRYWQALTTRFSASDYLKQTHYIVLGSRLYQCLATDVDLRYVHQVDHLQFSNLHACLKDIETHTNE